MEYAKCINCDEEFKVEDLVECPACEEKMCKECVADNGECSNCAEPLEDVEEDEEDENEDETSEQ